MPIQFLLDRSDCADQGGEEDPWCLSASFDEFLQNFPHIASSNCSVCDNDIPLSLGLQVEALSAPSIDKPRSSKMNGV
jgi:hypothetical protein